MRLWVLSPAPPHKPGTWEVEPKASDVQIHLWLHIEFKASYPHVHICILLLPSLPLPPHTHTVENNQGRHLTWTSGLNKIAHTHIHPHAHVYMLHTRTSVYTTRKIRKRKKSTCQSSEPTERDQLFRGALPFRIG